MIAAVLALLFGKKSYFWGFLIVADTNIPIS